MESFNFNDLYFLYVTFTRSNQSYDNVTNDKKLRLRHFKSAGNLKVVSEDKVLNQS